MHHQNTKTFKNYKIRKNVNGYITSCQLHTNLLLTYHILMKNKQSMSKEKESATATEMTGKKTKDQD